MAGQRRERERRALMVEVCGVLWSLLENWKRLEFLEIGNLVACEGRKGKQEKGKRKRIYK